jgi:CxxC motif-containing protein (DUF1111 family)
MHRIAAWLSAVSLAFAASAEAPPEPESGRRSLSDADSREPAPAAPIALTASEQSLFERGRELFEQRWVVAPSAFGMWGRGPTSNGEACGDCHANAGRGRPPLSPEEPLRSAVVRLGVGARESVLPHPAYGDQLQYQGVLGKVPGEGEAYVSWQESTLRYPDGHSVVLRAPRLRFEQLAFGPIGTETRTSMRVAAPLPGMGLLQAVPDASLELIAQRQDALGMGGRFNRVRDAASGALVAGRFGYKAGQPSLRQQIASALHADLGITSRLFPEENCPEVQHACAALPHPAQPEIDDGKLDALVFYVRALAPPSRTGGRNDRVMRGQRNFEQVGCGICHVRELKTSEVHDLQALSGRTIAPYTDLLLHDLGDGLADARADGLAGTRDWRTPALWGLRRAQTGDGKRFLLHDGRARSIEEAIAWHDGQARPARLAFMAMDAQDRAAVLAFLASL